jgi:hypothetical protein
MVVSRFCSPLPRSKGGDEAVKLYLFFALIDTLILLTYPILFIVSKLRKIARNKRESNQTRLHRG